MKRKHYTTWKKLEEDIADFDKLDISHHTILSKLASKLGIKKYSPLDSGTQGYAYYIPGNKVLKITTDASEAAESFKIKGKNLKHLVKVYDVYALKGNLQGIYAIVSELVDFNEDIIEGYENLDRILNKEFGYSLDHLLYKYSAGKIVSERIAQYTSAIKETMEPADANKTILFMKQMFEIVDELQKNEIKTNDWSMNNIGVKKNGNLAMFDLGYGGQKPSEDIEDIHLNEESSYSHTKFSAPSDERLQNRKGLMQFTAKDGNTYYISDSANPIFIKVYSLEAGLRPIGYLYLHHNIKNNTYVPDAGKNMAVQIDPEYRRLGLASAMYDYAEDILGFDVIPANLQHPEAMAMWKKRVPMLEFLGNPETPEFIDGVNNPMMSASPYPPTMNMNSMPLAEEEISQEELSIKDLPLKYSHLFENFVREVSEYEIREIAPNINLDMNPHALIMQIEKTNPELFDNFAEWLHSRDLK